MIDSLVHRRSTLITLLLGLVAGNTLAAGPLYWDWPRGREFSELELRGTTLDAQGHLTRGLDSRQVGPAGPEVVWHLGDDGHGGVLAGTGHGGGLFRLDGRGEQELLAQVGGPDVFCTLVRGNGDILVGTGSEGRLFALDEQGESRLLGQVDGGYVWALAEERSGGPVWVAAGSPAALYRLGEDEVLQKVCLLEAQNALAVTVLADGRLLVGTQGPGLLYVVDPDQPDRRRVVFQAAQDEIRQFIAGPEGRLFMLALNNVDDEAGAGAAAAAALGQAGKMMDLFEVAEESGVARSALYTWEEGDAVREYWSADLDLMMVAWSESWGWLAGGPLDQESGLAVLHALQAPAGHHPLASWPGGDILDLLVVPGGSGGDRILVAQAHPGSIREVGRLQAGDPEQENLALSPPLDAGRAVRWGRLNWQGSADTGDVRWSVRSGNQEAPGSGWSGWSDWRTGRDQALEVPDGRFLQWRMSFDKSVEPLAAAVTAVSLSAWQENVAPVVSNLTLEQVMDISLGGMMAGGENITQTFSSGLKAEFSKSSHRTRRADQERAGETRPLKVFSWLGRDANQDRLTYTLEFRPDGGGPWRAAVPETQETLGSWDTSAVADGQYWVRVVAHDGLDNPDRLRLQGEAVLGPVLVDNTPPELEMLKIEPAEGGFRVEFAAEDAMSCLAGASIVLPDGGQERLDPRDLICDSKREEFRTFIAWPRPGRGENGPVWPVTVEVSDLAGNTARAQGHLARQK